MKRKLFLLGLGLFLVSAIFGLTKTSLAADWIDITGSLNGTEINDLLQASDGSIYAGGDTDSGNIAKIWRYLNGSWTDITGTLDGSWINDLIELSDGTILAGGIYNTFHARVWKYSNGDWLNITGELSGYVVSSFVQTSDGSVYAGGYYTSDGLTYQARVWKYSNGFWNNITGNLTGETVESLLLAEDGSIYAGGEYDDGSSEYARVWKYSGDVWTDVTANLSGTDITSLAQTADGTIYAGGYYVDGSSWYARVWKESNGSWQDLFVPIVGTGSYISDLAILENNLYVAGYDDFTGVHRAKLWTYSNNIWSNDVLGEAAQYTAAWTVMVGTNGIYSGGYVNSIAKVWQRGFTDAEKIIIEEKNLQNGEQITLEPVLNGQTLIGQDLTIYFKNLPDRLTKNSAYWMKWLVYNKYPTKWQNKKKTALKKYWKLTTNLNKYKAKKKSQRFKIKVTFSYTKAQFKALKKKNSRAFESDLTLKYRTKTSAYKPLTGLWTDATLKHNKKKRTLSVTYFTKFPKNTYYFAIGVK